MFTKIGKNTMTVTTRRRGMALVVENMLLKIGASTMIGMAITADDSGISSSLAMRNRLAIMATATPATVPATMPTRALVPVTAPGLPDLAGVVGDLVPDGTSAWGAGTA